MVYGKKKPEFTTAPFKAKKSEECALYGDWIDKGEKVVASVDSPTEVAHLQCVKDAIKSSGGNFVIGKK